MTTIGIGIAGVFLSFLVFDVLFERPDVGEQFRLWLGAGSGLFVLAQTATDVASKGKTSGNYPTNAPNTTTYYVPESRTSVR